MFFSKKELHKDYCPRCGATDDLMVYTKRVNSAGILVYYYVCRPCNRIDKNRYYHAGNQKRYIDANKRYREKKA